MKEIPIFIDGTHGTTALEFKKVVKNDTSSLGGRLKKRIHWLLLDEQRRKSAKHRLEMLMKSQLGLLCLPDSSSDEIVKLYNNEILKRPKKQIFPKLLDTSSFFRVDPDWVYGFRGTKIHRQQILHAEKVSNPGCYAIAFVSAILPLTSIGLIKSGSAIVANGISGFSGGGKKLIELAKQEDFPFYSVYATNLQHKHCKEMKVHAKLDTTPIFLPSVIKAFRGMIVNIYISKDQIDKAKLLNRVEGLLQSGDAESNLSKTSPKHTMKTRPSLKDDCSEKQFERNASNNDGFDVDNDGFDDAKKALSNDLRKKITSEPSHLALAIYCILAESYATNSEIEVYWQEDNPSMFQSSYLPLLDKASNSLKITIGGNANSCVLIAQLDNLGYGAATNAWENAKLMLSDLA